MDKLPLTLHSDAGDVVRGRQGDDTNLFEGNVVLRPKLMVPLVIPVQAFAEGLLVGCVVVVESRLGLAKAGHRVRGCNTRVL